MAEVSRAAGWSLRWLGAICVVWWLVFGGTAVAGLPDGRVYELVSPAEKGGADVFAYPRRTVAATDGSAVVYTSLEGFGSARGSGVAFDYLARRSGDGSWATHGITPPQQPEDIGVYLFGGFDTRYLLFSQDLSHGVFLAHSPLTDAPNVASAINLYARDDALQDGPGSYALLTDAVSMQSASFQKPYVAGASADFSHVIFESPRNLTLDAASLDPSKLKLYEWASGSIILVGILPQDEGGGPTISEAGQGFDHNFPVVPVQGTISQDGRRVFFTAPPYSGDGLSGALYVRDDQGTATVADDTTLRINTPERTDCAPSCTSDGTPASFWAASPDGSKVFFTTPEQLTDDDDNGASDLYRFDLAASIGQRLTRLSVDHEPSDDADGYDVSGVLGASTDGSYVYFAVDVGQLVAGNPTGSTGGPSGNERIYVWHDGTLREVGAVNLSNELSNIVGRSPSFGFEKSSSVTPDGKHLVFLTEGTQELLSLYGKPEYDHGTSCPGFSTADCFEAYVYDADANGGAGDLQCASCVPTRQAAASDASFDPEALIRGGARGTAHQPRIISDDGRFVFFDSSEQLTSEDKNAAVDVYEFDTATGLVHLISSGQGSESQVFMDASVDGRDVFFTSRDQLSPTDHDQNRDLYDARIGGISGKAATLITPCSGDSCRPAAQSAGAPGTPPTVGAKGADDQLARGDGGAVFSLVPLSGKERRALAHGRRAHVAVMRSRAGRVEVALSALVGGRRRVVDRSAAGSSHAGVVRVSLRLDGAALRALARRGRLRVRLSATYSQSAVVQSAGVMLRQVKR